MEKHQRDNKPYRNKDGQEWRRLTRITNDERKECRLVSSRCANRDLVSLT